MFYIPLSTLTPHAHIIESEGGLPVYTHTTFSMFYIPLYTLTTHAHSKGGLPLFAANNTYTHHSDGKGLGVLTIREALHLSDCQRSQLSQLLSTELLLQKLTQRVVLQRERGDRVYVYISEAHLSQAANSSPQA